MKIGIGFAGALTLLFIYLKLTDKIDWSWFWVLSPLWISVMIVLGILFIALIIIGVVYLVSYLIQR